MQCCSVMQLKTYIPLYNLSYGNNPQDLHRSATLQRPPRRRTLNLAGCTVWAGMARIPAIDTIRTKR